MTDQPTNTAASTASLACDTLTTQRGRDPVQIAASCVTLPDMGMLGRGKQEFERTCERCGTQWYVTAAERREVAPNRMMIAGAQMQLIGGQKKAAQMRLHKEIVESRGRCRQCGSTSFSERQAP